jgi:hypothetical protein
MDHEIIHRDTEAFIPGHALGQTPHWLANDENRAGKEFSIIVLAFIGSEKLVDLRGKIIHSNRRANKWCNLTPYIPFETTAQCTNRQGFGHPKAFCKAEPIWAVCAEKYMTQKHECPTQTCKGGYRCIHPTLMCTDCGGQHRASNWNCPAKIQVSQEFREVIRARKEGRLLPQALVTN